MLWSERERGFKGGKHNFFYELAVCVEVGSMCEGMGEGERGEGRRGEGGEEEGRGGVGGGWWRRVVVEGCGGRRRRKKGGGREGEVETQR